MEFDIIFPRENETYAPADNFPVVLAVRNPMAALAFRPNMVWELYKAEGEGLDYDQEKLLDSGLNYELGFSPFDLFHDNVAPSNFTTDKNPHFFYNTTTQLNGTSEEGRYLLVWITSYTNCTDPKPYNATDRRTWQTEGAGWERWYKSALVQFSIKDGGIQPNQMALSNDRCEPDSNGETRKTDTGMALRVYNEIWVDSNYGSLNPDTSGYPYLGEKPGIDYHICGNMSNEPWEDHKGNLCGNRVDEKAAASIAAELGLPTGTPDDDSAGYKHMPSTVWAVLAGVGLVAFAL